MKARCPGVNPLCSVFFESGAQHIVMRELLQSAARPDF